jgi:hypothetical protein
MTKDPKKIREIVRACATLSKSAATPEERDAFADLAKKWQKFAADAEKAKSAIPVDIDEKLADKKLAKLV